MEKRLTSRKPLGDPNTLEIINLRLLHEESEESYLERDFKRWVEDEKNADINLKSTLDGYEKYENSKTSDKETQFILFQRAMKVLLITGQCVGLYPVSSILSHDISKIRFRLYSWRFLYTALIAISQIFSAVVCVYSAIHSPFNIRSISCLTLTWSSLCTIIIFIHIATKWENLVKEICNCNLDKYVNSGIIFQCNVSCIILLILAYVKHILFCLVKLSVSLTYGSHNLYEKFIKDSYSAVFEIGIPYNIPIAVLLQLNNMITITNWNYSDFCIICISLYLTSILNEINKKILWAADKNNLSLSIWGTLREDYNRATRLIRLFDNVFSNLTLLSFASNLFSICLQLFFILENGLRINHKNLDTCCNGPLHGYELSIYITYSLIFLLARFTTMCLVAASLNDASSVPTSGLYRIPSCSYSLEVQRFLDQVHDDVVALTGSEYFYITKELVLSMAGTILTYELVLLQFKSEQLHTY